MQASQPTKQRKDKALPQDGVILVAQGTVVPRTKLETIDSIPSQTSDPQTFAQNPPTAKEQLLAAEGGCYLSNQAAELLNVSESELQEWRETDQLIGLPLKDGTFVYPKWQFAENSILPGLAAVLAQFPYKSPWGRAAFMG
jgi:hypothetical protein